MCKYQAFCDLIAKQLLYLVYRRTAVLQQTVGEFGVFGLFLSCSATSLAEQERPEPPDPINIAQFAFQPNLDYVCS